MNPTFRHNLGDRVKDRITGMTGVIVSRSEHLFGCARYWISPQEMKDGKPVVGEWFDEDSIEVIETAVIAPQRYRVVEADDVAPSVPQRRAGGPTSQPSSSTRQTSR